jgi:hypothetical protein
MIMRASRLKPRSPKSQPPRGEDSHPAGTETRLLFDEAVARFTERVRQDPYLLAVILFGSASYDSVWEKSDVDVMLICRDDKTAYNSGRDGMQSFALTEYGLNFHVIMQPRAAFKKLIEGSVRSSIWHSCFAKSRLLYTRDRETRLLDAASSVIGTLYKAEKWLKVKKDIDYSFLWTLYCVTPLAMIEVYLDNQIAGREVIQQAMKINPEFFKSVYSDLIHKKKTAKDLAGAIEAIDGYLTRKTRTLFGPLLDYLKEADAPRSASEIDSHFRRHHSIEYSVAACEWLADKGVIRKLSAPVRLTPRSKTSFEELAFYYDGNPD